MKTLNKINRLKTKAGIAFCFAAVLFFSACKEEQHKPIVPGIKPAEVNGITVENKPGASEIKYNMSGEGILYVMAEYETKPGVKREAKSSVYKNTLLVDGFPRSGEYEVRLYTVGKDEQRSEPVVVKVNPQTPPVIRAFETVEMSEDFGGVRIKLKNEVEGELAIGLVSMGEDGKWKTDFNYTKMKTINYAVRGFDPIKRKFGVFVRDRWQNLSDTTFIELTPFFEQEIDRSDFAESPLPTDTYKPHSNGRLVMKNMFNDVIASLDIFHTIPNTGGIPQHFTFDMKKTIKLSRFKMWDRPGNQYIFAVGALKRFEVWGSNNPDADGSWASWTLLGTYEAIKPSGLPVLQVSTEDQAAAAAGLEYTVDINAPAVRYLRIKTLQTWGGVDYISICKMAFWGDYKN